MKPVIQTSQFKKDIKRLKKRGKDLEKLGDVVRILAADAPLEEKHRDHALIGKWVGSRDCHVETNWILIYRNEPDTLFLERSGSHSDLFKK
ncbi:type II toxin-antitoxin system YafQ family toxin [Puniceicoccus vermicola]|uniref:Type II toxin-antitoxin system YafQ family toxin n=1 Tax=Puniceicoccus vermicola TaxID=388746 RepID=A0A7X1B1C4_9BACT|nr:type II toxin-antitoxin system YafQ family toxin [Puniceicoccus vermicola]MBC2600567.1 type II toxin-antitoxin system YafQ family toxin [Puniceicoccus vermicola]MBC2603747.1 type II toxin-antitoxin system YafQ family toxin [Puniceicoccus vermicola]